ncbi:MAG TPA: hypothetical protein VJ831_13440 [Jatrophihabitantaceae bacterium]|nr:hypothetical protein [Jatrophihabitantaceae bacterium]
MRGRSEVKVPVLAAADGAEWEAVLVSAFEHEDHGLVIARRCVDVVELLALSASGLGRAALLAASLRRLDVDAVDRMHASDVRPVGAVRRGDTDAEERLRALGIEHVVPEDAEPAVVASVVLDALARPPERVAGGRAFADPLAESRDSNDARDEIAPNDDASLTSRNGSVLAVWGPTGAPGRTTVAVALADEIARLGAATLLVDADVYGGVVAALLGLLDESPGLAAACRAATSARLDPAALAHLCWQVAPGLRVLTGIALPQRWPEIRASALESVLAAARSMADYTVLDCGFAIETDEEIAYDSLAPRRNGATLALLDLADVLIVVGSADPIGLQRVVRALADLSDAEVATPVRLVLTKVRRGTAGRDAEVEAADALNRFAGRTPDAYLPFDQDALDAALMSGRSLAEAAPTSPLRASVVRLARTVTGIQSRSSRRSRRGRRAG